MTPFKRAGSKLWYLGPLSAAGIHVPRLSTGARDKATATAIERSLHELAATGWADLVERVASRDLKPITLYIAKLGGREKLEALRREATDPPLLEAIKVHRALAMDQRVKDGLAQLEAAIPIGARRSWVTDPVNLTGLYDGAIAGGLRPNSVRRSLHRAVSELISREFGRGRMLAIMADTRVPSELDERRVLLTIAEARRALDACDEEFRPILGLAMTTGIDAGPMWALRAYHYDESVGTLGVPDEKALDRARTLSMRGEPILEHAEVWLRRLVAGRRPDEPLMPFVRRGLRTRWEAVRLAIGRPDVRWKDLRGVFATYYLLAGGEPRELQAILGHSTMAMTTRYLRRLPAGNRETLRKHARTFGQPIVFQARDEAAS